MNGESKTTLRFTWRDWLRAIFILVLLIYTIVELTYRFSLPTDGWMVTENELPGLTYIQNILGEGSPLQAGTGSSPWMETRWITKFSAPQPPSRTPGSLVLCSNIQS